MEEVDTNGGRGGGKKRKEHAGACSFAAGIAASLTPPIPANKNRPAEAERFLVGDGGFEPPKALPADLQSVPFGHSGIHPFFAFQQKADDRTRTDNLLITNQLLCQLSNIGILN